MSRSGISFRVLSRARPAISSIQPLYNQPLPPSSCRTWRPIPRIINVLRILPVATGADPLQPQNPLCALRASVVYPLQLQNPLCALPASVANLSPLCFHILTNCFSRNPFCFTTIRIAPGCGGIAFSGFHEPRQSRVTSHVLSVGCRLFASCAFLQWLRI